jgi:hypothetical protein
MRMDLLVHQLNRPKRIATAAAPHASEAMPREQMSCATSAEGIRLGTYTYTVCCQIMLQGANPVVPG